MDSTPDVIHFNTDLASAGPVFITTTTQRVVTAQAFLNAGRHLATQKQSRKTFIYHCAPATPSTLSAYLSLLPPSLFSLTLFITRLRLSQPLRLYLFSFLSSFVLRFCSLRLD